MKERRSGWGLRGDFWADFLPYTLSSFLPPLRLLQYHSPFHFSPFIAPEIVYYIPISQVHLACSHLHFLPLTLSSIASLPVVVSLSFFPLCLYPFLCPLHLKVFFPVFLSCFSSLLLHIIFNALCLCPCPRLSCNKRVSVCQFDTVVNTYVYLEHKAKLWISYPVFITLIGHHLPNSVHAVV